MSSPAFEDEFELPRTPLEFVAGDTVHMRVLVEDPDPDSLDPEDPTFLPRDLTGWSAAAQVRKTAKDSQVLATFIINDLNELDETGVIDLYLGPSASQPLGDFTKCVGDLQLTDPYGEVETILGIDIKAEKDVTRV